MTGRQDGHRLLHTAIGAALGRAIRDGVRLLKACHDEQVLMWELSWQSSRVAIDHGGALSWTPSLDGPRLIGSYLSIGGEADTGDGGP